MSQEDALIREVEEDLRRDRVEQLARRYGPAAIGVVLLVVATAAGYVGWQTWTRSAREDQTLRLTQAVLIGQGQGATAAMDALASFAEDTDGTVAALAKLIEAGMRARNEDVETALLLYRQVSDDSTVDRLYRDLATVLLATHGLGRQDQDAAWLQTRLATLATPGNPWRFSAQELLALLAAEQGDLARAHEMLQSLATDFETPEALRNRAANLAELYGKSTS